ncbi:MAG: hypothetical protein B6I38_04190 [Anaerolineaceae bacterium 4572_5.1]|nr:MAG: hypothetical protein B6I38_04190 [Anaerolineaceae bacterium 4572_5.1]RLD06458.1 MAG: hypothetical protein DRI56_08010 [Chloroflexota bacterium]
MLKRKTFFNLSGVLLFLSVLACACQVLPAAREDETATPTMSAALPTADTVSQARSEEWLTLRQWAISAEASSEFADPEWGAVQAVGKPNAPGCGDYQFSWASAASDGIATLELTYETPVYITEIIIVQSFNPDQVVKIEVLDLADEFQTVYQKEPVSVDRPCPYYLSVLVDDLDFKSNVIRVTVDQSVLGLGRNEIDAVQLLGASSK